MPSKSKAQARLMRIAANSRRFAEKVGIPQSVAREFHEADKASGTKHLPARKRKKVR